MTPEALASLHATAFAHERPWSREEFAALLARPGSLLLGDGRAALLARVILDEAEVLTIATRPDARRQGLGRALLAAFHQAAAQAGASRAFLEVAEDNAPARALYEGAGYAVIGRRRGYYARGTGVPAAALVMACALP